jgi:hypothetical protein
LSVERTGQRLSAWMWNEHGGAWNWARDIPVYRTQRMLLAIQHGEGEAARENLRDLALNKYAAVTRDSNFLFAAARLAQAAVALEEREAAADLYEVLQPYAALFAISDFSFSLGSVSYYLGVLARSMELRTEARQHFETGLDANLRTGHELASWHSRLALAELMSDSRSRLERTEALALASEVRAAAQRYGLNGLRAAAVVTVERLTAATGARITRTGLERARPLDKTVRGRRMRMR